MSGPLDELGAVSRATARGDHEGRPTRVVVATRTFPSDLEDVWDAVTSAERIPRWFLPVSGDLRVGGHFQLEGNANGVVLSCDPPHAFSVTWEFAGEVTWLDVRLDGGDGSTTLELQHSAPADDERWAEYGPGAVGVGWDMGLLGLVRHLADGSVVDAAEAMAWAGSTEGREFTRRSSDGWCDAAVAGGEDEHAARAAAARTTAAYTGEPRARAVLTCTPSTSSVTPSGGASSSSSLPESTARVRSSRR